MIDQYYTPTWAAELLLSRHFPELTMCDTVLDPSCGDGRLLLAVPDHIQAIGVEIDETQAALARSNTGREIHTGDFTTIPIDMRPTAIFGNPPFRHKLFLQILSRCYEMLDYDQKAGFILPVYFFQTANTVMSMAERWSIAQELIPRNLFHQLEKPLCFATFTKSRRTVLSGFFLYAERAALESLRERFRAMFVGNGARANVWRDTVAAAIELNGGIASLGEMYQTIENNRPTGNRFWREKIRQTAARHFARIEPGVYAVEHRRAS